MEYGTCLRLASDIGRQHQHYPQRDSKKIGLTPLSYFSLIATIVTYINGQGLALAAPLDNDTLEYKQWIQCQAQSGQVSQFGISSNKVDALIVTPLSKIDPIEKGFSTFYPGRLVISHVDTAGAPLRIDYEINRKTLAYKITSTLMRSGRIIYRSRGHCSLISDPFKNNLF